jgi:Uma2 family endonuclease
MISKDRPYSREEYLAISAQNPQRRFQLIHGEIVEKMPTQFHALIVSLLNFFLVAYLRENSIGWVLVEARYGLPEDPENDRIPDLSYVSKEKGELVKLGAAPYMPDLAIEVQSPGQSDRFMAELAAYYLEHGSKEVWLIYPSKELVEVLSKTDRQLLTKTDILSSEKLLPNFKLKVGEIFPQEEKPT